MTPANPGSGYPHSGFVRFMDATAADLAEHLDVLEVGR